MTDYLKLRRKKRRWGLCGWGRREGLRDSGPWEESRDGVHGTGLLPQPERRVSAWNNQGYRKLDAMFTLPMHVCRTSWRWIACHLLFQVDSICTTAGVLNLKEKTGTFFWILWVSLFSGMEFISTLPVLFMVEEFQMRLFPRRRGT